MILTTSGPLTNPLGWSRAPAMHKDALEQAVFAARTFEFGPEHVTRRSSDEGTEVILRHPSLAALRRRIALPRWSEPSRVSWGPVNVRAPSAWVLLGAGDTASLGPVTIHCFEKLEGTPSALRSGEREVPVNHP